MCGNLVMIGYTAYAVVLSVHWVYFIFGNFHLFFVFQLVVNFMIFNLIPYLLFLGSDNSLSVWTRFQCSLCDIRTICPRKYTPYGF